MIAIPSPRALLDHLPTPPPAPNPHPQDPTRYPRVIPSALSANLSFLLLLGTLTYQYWFWFARVPSLDHLPCQQYGFVFGQVRLNSKASVVLHALMYFWLGLVCLYILLLKLRAVAGFPDPGAGARRPKKAHVELLQHVDVWIRILVALAVTVAVELTVAWNEIRGVAGVEGAAQTIPLVVGVGAVVRILYVAMGREAGREVGARPVLVRSLPVTEASSVVSRPSRVQRR